MSSLDYQQEKIYSITCCIKITIFLVPSTRISGTHHDGRVRDFQLGGHVSFLEKVIFKRSLKEAGKEGNEDVPL